jgi:5'-nucleotidase
MVFDNIFFGDFAHLACSCVCEKIDIHAHFDQFNKIGSECRQQDIDRNECYGGLSRVKTMIDKFRANTTDLLLLDAGDQFQGTLFFNQFGGEASANMMNQFNYDLMTIGNHGTFF